MAIKKQEFYEGAALHLLVRGGRVTNVRYRAPLFIINRRLCVLLKYSTKVRSPWGFTFTPAEQRLLRAVAAEFPTAIGLICASDGVVAINYDAYASIAPPRNGALHVACYRNHGEHYDVSGPEGWLERKIAPSRWQKLLDEVQG
jgi:hypothetical protein